MTEADWLGCADPTPMLEFLRDKKKLTERRVRLFAVAACRRVWHLLTEADGRPLVELAERYADGIASPEQGEREDLVRVERLMSHIMQCATREGRGAAYAAEHATIPNITDMLWQPSKDAAGAIAWEEVGEAGSARDAERWAAAWNAAEAREFRVQAALLRDIFGNPFRTIKFKKRWRTPEVVALATTIDDHRSFERLPELATLLQAAGCDSEEVLAHLRGLGLHARGCHVIDLVVGKA